MRSMRWRLTRWCFHSSPVPQTLIHSGVRHSWTSKGITIGYHYQYEIGCCRSLRERLLKVSSTFPLLHRTPTAWSSRGLFDELTLFSLSFYRSSPTLLRLNGRHQWNRERESEKERDVKRSREKCRAKHRGMDRGETIGRLSIMRQWLEMLPNK